MLVEFQTKTLDFPSGKFGELLESNDAIDDFPELHRRFDRDGYLFLRNLIDRDAVLKGRAQILDYMAQRQALVPNTPVLDGVMPKGGKTVNMLGNQEITHHPLVQRVLEAPEISSFLQSFYAELPTTFNYKWLRAVGNEQFTGSHLDVVYMGRGSNRVNTVWIPFGDIPVNQGTLVMCEGSHRLDSFSNLRETYGRSDVDRDNTEGWFSSDPEEILHKFGGKWLTAAMRAGDILTFGLYTMHGSTTNTTNKFRLSCDVRFQPISDPVDERWGNGAPTGYRKPRTEPAIPMATSREEWGL